MPPDQTICGFSTVVVPVQPPAGWLAMLVGRGTGLHRRPVCCQLHRPELLALWPPGPRCPTSTRARAGLSRLMKSEGRSNPLWPAWADERGLRCRLVKPEVGLDEVAVVDGVGAVRGGCSRRRST